MKGIWSIKPENVGWLEAKLESHEMDHLWKCIDDKKEDHREQLAGNISESYLIKDKNNWFEDNVLSQMVVNYEKIFKQLGNDIPTTNRHPFHLRDLWVNYQKQHEFNPLHNHTGVYSFVIWMKIPVNYDDQVDLPNSKGSNLPLNSAFTFEYLDILGEMKYYRYGLSKSDEGSMLLFPSKLHHQVYPFYNCDKTRISISGNLLLDTSNMA